MPRCRRARAGGSPRRAGPTPSPRSALPDRRRRGPSPGAGLPARPPGAAPPAATATLPGPGSPVPLTLRAAGGSRCPLGEGLRGPLLPPHGGWRVPSPRESPFPSPRPWDGPTPSAGRWGRGGSGSPAGQRGALTVPRCPRSQTRTQGRVAAACRGRGRGSDLLALENFLEFPLDPLHRDVSHLRSEHPLAAAGPSELRRPSRWITPGPTKMAPAPSMRARATGSAAAAQEGPPCARSGAGTGVPRQWGLSTGRWGRRRWHTLSAFSSPLSPRDGCQRLLRRCGSFNPARRSPRETASGSLPPSLPPSPRLPACRHAPCHGPGRFLTGPGDSVRRPVCRQRLAAASRHWRAPGQS